MLILQQWLWCCALFLILGALAGIKFKIQEIPQIDFDPLDQFKEPQVLLDLEACSGPIMIMIDYQINENDLKEFLEVMARRRHIRRRDGARQWFLYVILENLAVGQKFIICQHG
ncbi:Transmembrane secretion effector [Bartonella sp. WD12.1]|nr:Transmembrane secretion effector [Bartonella sp. WD12.1]